MSNGASVSFRFSSAASAAYFAGFLSEEDQAALESGRDQAFAERQRKLPIPEVLSDLVRIFRNEFPAIEFVFETLWRSGTMNAFAENGPAGEMRVMLHGDYLRFVNDLDAIALVISHEVAHHIGNTPLRQPSGHACEPEADFLSVREVMPQTFPADAQFRCRRGIDAMKLLLRNATAPLRLGAPSCAHPANACRVAFWEAALGGGSRPHCF